MMARAYRFAAVLAIVLILSLSGCGPAAERDTIEIRWWHTFSAVEYNLYVRQFIVEFEKNNPGIRVKAEYVGGGGGYLAEKLLANIISGDLPDVAITYPRHLPRLVETGHVLPIEVSAEDKEDIYPAVLGVYTFPGPDGVPRIWGAPVDHALYALYYNTKLFQEAGLDEPPETWDDLLEYAKILTKDTDDDDQVDQWGFSRETGPSTILNLYFSKGVEFISEDGRTILFDSPEAVEALKLWGDLEHTYNVTITPLPRDAWLRGKVGMMIGGSWYTTDFEREQIPFDVAKIPPLGDAYATEAAPDCLILLKTTPERVRAANTLVNWMMGYEVNRQMAMDLNRVPIRKSIVESDEYELYMAKHPYMEGLLEMVPYEMPRPQHPAWPKIEEHLFKATERVTLGEMTAAEALAAAAQDAQADLDKYWETKEATQ